MQQQQRPHQLRHEELDRKDFPTVGLGLWWAVSTVTTVGYGDVVLPERWRLLGPIEAAVGILMLGWSTGILVAVIGTIYRELFPSPKTR